jgi:plasmid replication initiation protein
MSLAARRRVTARVVLLDRSLERLPLFRLSDSADDTAISCTSDDGGRWRVLPNPGDRIPGTFDQDVYVELMHRFHEAGEPADGAVTFTLHAFLRSMGRQVDGRTYEQLRGALARLEHTTLESVGSYYSSAAGAPIEARFSILTSVVIERRRVTDRDQLALFEAVATAEPGVARVIIAPNIRENVAGRFTSSLSVTRYLELASPVARRLYRLLEVARAEDVLTWRVSLDRLKELLPLVQRYPSHLQRVLQPAHEMLEAAGVVRSATVRQQQREWFVDYVLAARGV